MQPGRRRPPLQGAGGSGTCKQQRAGVVECVRKLIAAQNRLARLQKQGILEEVAFPRLPLPRGATPMLCSTVHRLHTQ